jgi:hypothetical protein
MNDFSVGKRVFLTDGPIIPGTILPRTKGADPQCKVVMLDGATEPELIRACRLTPATFPAGRRVFRHAGGPHRFGIIPPSGKVPKSLTKLRMVSEEESIVVRWDNGELELVVKSYLTPILFEVSP